MMHNDSKVSLVLYARLFTLLKIPMTLAINTVTILLYSTITREREGGVKLGPNEMYKIWDQTDLIQKKNFSGR